MRALKILTIVMGVLIVGGTATLGVLIARRLGSAQGAPFSVRLDEPEGTRIAAMAGVQDRLALYLQGGGPDRVVLIDPHSGARAGRLVVAPGPETRP